MNRKGEWGENLPPDFGVLEDSIYKVKRKNTNQQQRSDKSKKRKVEVCEAVCEMGKQTDAVCEIGKQADAGGTWALPTESGCISENGSTQHTDFAHVKNNSLRYDNSIQENISHLNLPTKTHNSCDTLKLANGKHGRISGYFEKVVRHSGVNQGSKLGKS